MNSEELPASPSNQSDSSLTPSNQVATISVDAAAYVRHIYREVEENLEYITQIEGIEIPQVWRDKILQPIDFAIQVLEADDAVNDLVSSDSKPPQHSSNPPKGSQGDTTV